MAADLPRVADIEGEQKDFGLSSPSAASGNVVNFREFATRGKHDIKPKKSATKKKSATRGKPVIEPVKASAGTWAFRLRWNDRPGRPVAYVSRVSDSIYKTIRKGNYAAFKEQLIASYCEGAIRAGNQA